MLLPQITTRKEIKITDVSGMSVSKAIDVLQDQGFKVADEQKEISDPEIAAGKVVKTNPVAGLKKTKGSTIILYVSIGDTNYTMEDFTGQNYLTVKGKLEAFGIYVLVEKKEPAADEQVEDGTVMSQSVPVGTKLAAKDTVTLYIPDVASEYPNFADGTFTIEDVQAFCDKYGVTLNKEYVETNDYVEGSIISQSKPEGYMVIEGVTLTIKVAVPVGADENDPNCNELDTDCDQL